MDHHCPAHYVISHEQRKPTSMPQMFTVPPCLNNAAVTIVRTAVTSPPKQQGHLAIEDTCMVARD